MLQEVPDAQPLRVVHGKRVEFFRRHEAELRALLGDGQGAADDPGLEADVELPAYLSVAVGDDMVGVGVRADESRDFDVGPVSSLTSRTAAPGRESSMSMAPPGSAHKSLSRRRWRSTRPSPSVTTAEAATTRLFGRGAFGSS